MLTKTIGQNGHTFQKEDLLIRDLDQGKKTPRDKVGIARILNSELNASLWQRTTERNLYLAETLIRIWEKNALLPLREQIIMCLSAVDHKEATKFLSQTYEKVERFLKRNKHSSSEKVQIESKAIKNACIISQREHFKIINEAIENNNAPNDMLKKYEKARKTILRDFFEKHDIKIEDDDD